MTEETLPVIFPDTPAQKKKLEELEKAGVLGHGYDQPTKEQLDALPNDESGDAGSS